VIHCHGIRSANLIYFGGRPCANRQGKRKSPPTFGNQKRLSIGSMSTAQVIPMQPVMDYTWTTGNDSAISHIRVIDSGAGGEVHEVFPNFLFI
jgi:hypothetical protein